MILIITTTVLAVICVSLVIALTFYYREYKRTKRTLIDVFARSAILVGNIEKGIKRFNKKYDVQLRLGEFEEGNHKGLTLCYTDPKEESKEEEAKHE